MGGPGSGIGNKSRTGMRKPQGSGSKNQIGKRKMVSFWLGVELKQALEDLASHRKLTMGYLVREAIADLIDNYTNTFLARDKGQWS